MAWENIEKFYGDGPVGENKESFITRHEDADYDYDVIYYQNKRDVKSDYLFIVFSPNELGEEGNSSPTFVDNLPTYELGGSEPSYSQSLIKYINGEQSVISYNESTGEWTELSDKWEMGADILFIRDKNAKWFLSGIVTNVANPNTDNPTEETQTLEEFAEEFYNDRISGHLDLNISVIGGHEGAGYGALRFGIALYDHLDKIDNPTLKLFAYNFQSDLDMSGMLEEEIPPNENLYSEMFPQTHLWNPEGERFKLGAGELGLTDAGEYKEDWHYKYILYPKLLNMATDTSVDIYIGGGHIEESIDNESQDMSTPSGYNNFILYNKKQIGVFGEEGEDGTIKYNKVDYILNIKNHLLQQVMHQNAMTYSSPPSSPTP